jgi:hypothetical protein
MPVAVVAARLRRYRIGFRALMVAVMSDRERVLWLICVIRWTVFEDGFPSLHSHGLPCTDWSRVPQDVEESEDLLDRMTTSQPGSGCIVPPVLVRLIRQDLKLCARLSADRAITLLVTYGFHTEGAFRLERITFRTSCPCGRQSGAPYQQERANGSGEDKVAA